MAFADPLPWWAIVAAVLGAAGAALLAGRGAPTIVARRVLGTLRFLTLMLLVGLLMRPVVGSVTGSDALVLILVDTSRSMGIEDVDGGRRIDRARHLVTGALLPALADRFETELLAFGESVSRTAPDELTASARRSDIAGALADVVTRYGARPIAGIVLLSDGGQTAGPTSAGDPSRGVPVFAVGVGASRPRADREILGVTAVEAVLDDSRVDLAVSAVSHGYGAEPFELRLLENGRPVDVRRVRPASDGTPVHEVFQVGPAADVPTIYTAEIPVAAGEIVPENNTRSVIVPPASRPRRVLLVQGAPGFEHSFLRRAWGADRSLHVDAVVRQGRNEEGVDTYYIQAHPTRSAALATGFPARREDLFLYDAVVLANVDRDLLGSDAMDAIGEFVSRRGGGLLVLGARAFHGQGLRGTPIDDLLPLDPADRTRGVVPASRAPSGPGGVVLTAAGEAHPMMQLAASLDDTRREWTAMPPLASVASLGAPRAGADVLALTAGAGGSGRPLVAVQRYGQGRSMVFTGEASWRWRMHLPSDDRRYDTFWRQAIRWIALPAPDPVALRLPEDVAQGEAVALRVAARTPRFEPLDQASVTVRVTRPDGRIDTLPADREPGDEDGWLVARYMAADPGVYRVTAEVTPREGTSLSASAWMLAGGADHEMADPRQDRRALQRIAAVSGGRVIEPGDVPALVEHLSAAAPAAVQRVQRDLWHSAWFLAVILMLLSGEWVLRRRWGLR